MKPLLASQLISALSIPKKGIASYIDGKYAKAMARETQISIINAQKFVISDELLIQATKLSYLKPKELFAQIEYVIPPFDNVWFEWNEHLRVKIGRDELVKLRKDIAPLNLTQIPENVGYHIQKLYDENLYTCYYQNENNKFYSPEMGFHIHNELYTYEHYVNQWSKFNPDNPNVIKENDYYKEVVNNGVIMLSQPYCMHFQKDKDLTPLMGYLSPTQTASTHWARTAEEFETPMQSADAEHHAMELHKLTGDARFMIALMSLLNTQITTTERVIPDPKVIYTQFLKRVPRNEYKVLDINISANKIRKIYKSRATGIKKKQHHRRGHWRFYKTGKKTWIKNCLAGDPNLGFIHKDYNIITNKED